MSLTPQQVDSIIELIRVWYPAWASVDDPGFQELEVIYKREAMVKAKNLIGQDPLQELLNREEYTEFLHRLERAGQLTNLLYLSAPSTGDLRVLHAEQLDPGGFAHAVFDLLYGAGKGEERFQRYVEYVTAHGLDNYWTFPTYLLYFCHPDSELFVKPVVTREFIKYIEAPFTWTTVPSGKVYAQIKQVAQDVLEAFAPYGARDMVDAQSIIWTASRVAQDRLTTPERREEFSALFSEFLDTYPQTEDGRKHITGYGSGRTIAAENYAAICAAADRGDDITDDVLLKMLPYADNQRNHDAGAWVHLAFTVNGDLRKWYERAGRTKPDDWPLVAQAILDFVRLCVNSPERLGEACTNFAAASYSKGFQAGTLSPILNALRPDEFALLNTKTRTVLGYFAEQKFGQNLTDYPGSNKALRQLAEELGDILDSGSELGILRGDLLDMFSHWLVAVKNFEFRDNRYWQIEPGDYAWHWTQCLDGGFISLGWDELGNLSGINRTDFAGAVNRYRETHDVSQKSLEQAWKFARWVNEGDRIVATRGANTVLGIGTVTGAYYFVEGEANGHRIPVAWDDTTRRQVGGGAWQGFLSEIERTHFEGILNAAPIAAPLAPPFTAIFSDEAEANWAFDFICRTLHQLGVRSLTDERVVISFPKNHYGRLLRVVFGNWVILDFQGSETANGKSVGVALLTQGLEGLERYSHWGPFKLGTEQGPIAVYNLPYSQLRPMDEALNEHFNRTMQQIRNVFANWSSSNVRSAHQQEIIDGIYDEQKRAALLRNPPDKLPTENIPDSGGDGPISHPHSPFSDTAIKLLTGIANSPTKAFYDANKQAFQEEVEEPFKRIMQQVAEHLPTAIHEVMETEKRIFGRFLKNDFGQGGAWPFYWGAFYPKGSKRALDAQLSVWMNHELLECGFFIGNYGSAQRERFDANCRRYAPTLEQDLADILSKEQFYFGGRETWQVTPGAISKPQDADSTTWRKFLHAPTEFNCDVSVPIPTAALQQMTEQELVEHIARVHTELFPLVLLAVLDDPLPAIADYLDIDGEIEDEPLPLPVHAPYPLEQMAKDTGVAPEALDRWVRALRRKKQAIFYGPPGTGKTFMAKKLAQHLIGGGVGEVEVIQFHPAYAYEDFMQGIRPQAADGKLTYPTVPGRFLSFCNRVREREGSSVLIIDEINRANLARVFGELMFLLEYRSESVPLAVDGTGFSIPENVYIIGTMNTADRSIALVDHALRRRFAFLPLYPDFDVLRHYFRDKSHSIDLEGLIRVVQDINQKMGDHHYHLGISFFMDDDIDHNIQDIWRTEIEPYLEEYFFDQSEIVDRFKWDVVEGRISG